MLPISGKFRFSFLLISALLLASCQQAGPSPSAAQTSIRVELSPTLQYLSPAIQACSLQAETLHIILEEKPSGEMNKTGADVSLRCGDKQIPAGTQIYRLGSDRLIFAVHKDNPCRY